VSCPCAFGIAVPLARELAMQRLRRQGVFVRRADVLDRACRVRRVVFDKTGTLTDGSLRLSAAGRQSLDALSSSEHEVLAHLVAYTGHPVARALRTAMGASRVLDGGSTVSETPGQGVTWTSADGRLYRLGRSSFALEMDDPTAIDEHVFFSRDGRCVASFSLDESPHDDVRSELAELEADGYETYVMSGDRADRVSRMALAAGVAPERAYGGLTPDGKGALIHSLGGEALMIGDGVNDSLGFREALASAAPISRHAAAAGLADLFYTGLGISAIRRTLEITGHLRRVTRETLSIAVTYNAIVIGLAFLGYVTPVVAAVVMPISSAGTAIYVTLRMTRRVDA